VAARYPEAEPLPARPALDALLASAGFGWVWSPESQRFRAPTTGIAAVSSGTTTLERHRTLAAPLLDTDPEVAAARALEEKLQRAVREGAWLVLAVSPNHLERAERELVRRFSVDLRSLEELLLRALKDEAVRRRVEWSVVLGADAAAPTSPDGAKLRQLVDLALPAVERELESGAKTLLLTHPGLLARYDRMRFLHGLRERVGRRAEAPLFGAWLLVACSDQAQAPMVDGKPVPVVTPGDWARIPEAWIANRHRGGRLAEGPT
jgi:hypothetical protein